MDPKAATPSEGSDDAATVADGATVDPGPAADHEQIGRYRVLRPLGAGGMGVVYLAYDVDLDRRVAVKLLRGASSPDDTQGRSRLLREAQAMAKLAHPNVVSVFEVGEHENEVFVAMEYVPGSELGGWSKARPRTWAETLTAYRQAGRGLAAAHAQGMVHRDFKPANALVGDDGRVRVLDFGLARTIDAKADVDLFDSHFTPAPDDLLPSRVGSAPSGGLLATPLTQAGLIMGTPAYMAPEQHFGQDVDARADQFSFCVALWEALYGARPYQGATVRELARAKLSGEISEPATGRKVPAWVRKAVVRGLSGPPDDRWPSMGDLLDELAKDPAAIRRRWMLVGGVAAVVGIGAWAGTRDAGPTCTGSNELLAQVWNPARATGVEAAVMATELPFAARSWQLVQARLDGWAVEWVDARTQNCEATQMRGEQSSEAMDLRMSCYERKLRDLGARIDVLEEVDSASLEKLAASMAALPDLGACEDPAVLAGGIDPPSADQRSAVDEARDRLAKATALGEAGRYEQAVSLATEVGEDVGEIGYAPLLAEADFALGRLQARRGDYEPAGARLGDAYWAALAQRHDSLALDAATEMVHLVGVSQGDVEAGLRWGRDAGAVLERLGAGDERRARLLHNEGIVHNRAGALEKAQTNLQEALEIRRRVEPEGHLVAITLISIGTIAQSAGRMKEAADKFIEARVMLEERLGPDHPDVAAGWNNLGNVLRRDRDFDAAHEAFAKALSIRERAHGPDSDRVARVVLNIGNVYLEQENYADAQLAYERALPILERTAGPKNPNVAGVVMNLGTVALRRGRHGVAREHFEKAGATFSEVLGPQHPVMVEINASLGEALMGEGEVAGAVAAFDRAHEVMAKAPGDPAVHGRVRWLRGRAIYDSGDRARGLELIHAAREQLTPTGTAGEQSVAEIDAWLAASEP